jgi:nickel-dependent lactate racemase
MLKLRSSAWYNEKEINLKIPSSWEIKVVKPKETEAVNDRQIRKAISSPIKSKTIKELAKSKDNATILVDDLTRPTPANKVLPFIINELRKGGIPLHKILIVLAVGTHRPLLFEDLKKKLGKEVANSIETVNHLPYEGLEYLGESSRGTPIYINKFVARAGLKIGVGSVIPYLPKGTGFGGGAKILVPGVSGIETIAHHHSIEGGELGQIENNMRKNIEEIALRVGLDFIVNVTINERREINGVFAGDVIKAHRKGAEYARNIYNFGSLPKGDVAIVNAYPFDVDFLQTISMIYLGRISTSKNGLIIVHGDCCEGSGYHTLSQKGGRFWREEVKEEIEARTVLQPITSDRKVVVLSPNAAVYDVKRYVSKDAILARSWQDVKQMISKRYGERLKVVVFKCGRLCLFN